MTDSRRLAVVPTLLALALSGCAGATPDRSPQPGSAGTVTAPAPVRLPPARFAATITEPGRVLLNVHTPPEGQIAGTDLSIPYDQLRARAAELPADRATPLAVYCRSGRMSALAVVTLAGLGYRDIVELEGGMEAWVASGRTLQPSPPG